MLAQHRHPDFSVSVAPGVEGGTVITVTGELDATGGAELRRAFDDAWKGEGGVVVDLRGCTFMDSRGIASIVGVAWQLKGTECKLVLRGVGPRVRQILELTGVVEHSAIVIEPLEGDRDSR